VRIYYLTFKTKTYDQRDRVQRRTFSSLVRRSLLWLAPASSAAAEDLSMCSRFFFMFIITYFQNPIVHWLVGGTVLPAGFSSLRCVFLLLLFRRSLEDIFFNLMLNMMSCFFSPASKRFPMRFSRSHQPVFLPI